MTFCSHVDFKVTVPMDKGFPEILRDCVLEEKQENFFVNETAIFKENGYTPDNI